MSSKPDQPPPNATGPHASEEKAFLREEKITTPPPALVRLLAIVVISVLVYIMVLLGVNIWFQHDNYQAGIQAALNGNPVDHAGVLSYSRSWDFAVAKTSSLFLSFTLIFMGALYVLRSIEGKFSLSVDGKTAGGALRTSSPGLVMVTLGVVLVALVLFSKSVVQYTPGLDRRPAVKQARKGFPVETLIEGGQPK